ncbi:MAG: hypothetical protein ACRC5C_13205 [Bacilli bacterium]
MDQMYAFQIIASKDFLFNRRSGKILVKEGEKLFVSQDEFLYLLKNKVISERFRVQRVRIDSYIKGELD